MSTDRETEIKFLISDLQGIASLLKPAGFRLVTPRTHETNTLYDQPGAKLRRKGALLRLRQFGPKWTLTYKDKASPQSDRHKSRREIETRLESGESAARILEALGFKPSFRYEKFRSEWSDSTGHVVVDETPIGNYGEIEGPAAWIDATARLLHLKPEHYITSSYSELFAVWRHKTKSRAAEMTFTAVKKLR